VNCLESIHPAISTVAVVTRRTALRELVEARLGEDVCAWAARRRRQEPDIGWRTLVEELHELTGRRVSHGSLATWCRSPDAEEVD
jgi:hypothetical protein